MSREIRQRGDPGGLGAPSQIVVDDLGGARVVVVGLEADHLRKALRIRPGERVRATDGRGLRATLEITGFHDRAVETVVRERHLEPASERRFWIAAFAAGARFDWLVEKSVELGVSGLIVLLPRRGPRPKPERWERLARAALGQCLGAWEARISSAPSARGAIEAGVPGNALWTSVQVADSTAPAGARDPRLDRAGDHLLVVGPPEGFTEADRAFLSNSPDLARIRLGDRRLRSETAALALLTLARLGESPRCREVDNSPGRG